MKDGVMEWSGRAVYVLVTGGAGRALKDFDTTHHTTSCGWRHISHHGHKHKTQRVHLLLQVGSCICAQESASNRGQPICNMWKARALTWEKCDFTSPCRSASCRPACRTSRRGRRRTWPPSPSPSPTCRARGCRPPGSGSTRSWAQTREARTAPPRVPCDRSRMGAEQLDGQTREVFEEMVCSQGGGGSKRGLHSRIAGREGVRLAAPRRLLAPRRRRILGEPLRLCLRLCDHDHIGANLRDSRASREHVRGAQEGRRGDEKRHILRAEEDTPRSVRRRLGAVT